MDVVMVYMCVTKVLNRFEKRKDNKVTLNP